MAKKTTDRRPWEDLVQEGIEATKLEDDAPWRHGDLALEVVTGYGEHKLQDYAKAIFADFNTLKIRRWVASKFPEKVRRRTISFSHHAEVAGLDDLQDALHWLDLAQDAGWTVRLLRQKLKEHKRQELIAENTKRAAAYLPPPGLHFHKDDCLKLIDDPERGLPNDSVKLLLVDPPYGMAHKTGIAGDMTREEAAKLLYEVLEKMEPKLREDAMCAIFCEWDDAALQREVEKFFTVHGRPRWDKGRGVGEFFSYDSEDIIIGTKKDRGKDTTLPKTFLFPLSGIIPVPLPVKHPGSRNNPIHPMEKPKRLLYMLIAAMTVKGDLVADPMAGSGSALLAASQMACRHWGAELNTVKDKEGNEHEQDWYPLGAERLADWLRVSGQSGLPLSEERWQEPIVDPDDIRESIVSDLRQIHRLGKYDFRNAHMRATRSMVAEPEAGLSDADLQAAREFRDRFPDVQSVDDAIRDHPDYENDEPDYESDVAEFCDRRSHLTPEQRREVVAKVRTRRAARAAKPKAT